MGIWNKGLRMEDIYDGCHLDLISIITLSHRFNIVYLLLFPPVRAHITKYSGQMLSKVARHAARLRRGRHQTSRF